MELVDVSGVLWISRLDADAGISVFVQSTFDTDYILIREESADAAVKAWQSAGHKVTASS